MAGAIACVLGLILFRFDHQLDRARFVDILSIALVSVLFAGLVKFSRIASFPLGILIFWVGCQVYFSGIASVAAVVALTLDAIVIGDLLVAKQLQDRNTLLIPVGLVIIGSVVGWLTPYPMHNFILYLGSSALLITLRMASLAARLRELFRSATAALDSCPGVATFALVLLGIASTGAWLPTMQADDLAYHLGLPSSLQTLGFYRPDIGNQMWSYAPWLADVIQGVAQVLARREARGAVNVVWLGVASSSLCVVIARLGGSEKGRWLGVALFASIPLLGALCAGMQTELAGSAVALSLAAAILATGTTEAAASVAVLAGGLVALKLGQAVAAAIMLTWFFARSPAVVPRRFFKPVLLFLFTGLSSYFYAWLYTGNPFFPLLNNLIVSSYPMIHVPADSRWQAGLSLDLPWRLTFQTSLYLEAAPGALGFMLIALSGAWLLSFINPRTRALAFVATLVMVLPLIPAQYARYAFPGIALLIPALVVAVESFLAINKLGWVAVATCILNAGFQANAGWSMNTVQRRRLVTSAGDPAYVLKIFAPERSLIKSLRIQDPSSSIVLAVDRTAPYVAELAARGRNVAWYSADFYEKGLAADADLTGAQWGKIFDESKAAWILTRPAQVSLAQTQALLNRGASIVETVGDAQLWRAQIPAVNQEKVN